jgi:predicted lipoprotein with Yx(FWY)xxD motif
VQIENNGQFGKILADPRGFTLYINGNDTPDVSTCNDQCALLWPPLIAFGPSFGPPGMTGVLDVMTRTDGKKQLTRNRLPLYTYSKDSKPGDTSGNGVDGIWRVVLAT